MAEVGAALRAWWLRWRTPVKLATIGLVLAALFWGLSRDPSVARLGQAAPWTILSLLIAHASFLLMALRWKLSMDVARVPFSFGASWAVTAQSFFYFQITPFSLGFDIARFAKAFALAPDRPRPIVVAAVMLDRIIGMAAMIVMFVACGLLAFGPSRVLALVSVYALVLCMLAGAGLLLIGLLGYVFRRRIAEMAPTVLALARERSVLLGVTFATALAQQLVYGLALWVAAIGWDIKINPVQSVFASAGALFFNFIPANAFGIGATQVAGIAIYKFLGLCDSEGVLLVALSYLAHFSFGVLGGVAEASSLDRRLARGA